MMVTISPSYRLLCDRCRRESDVLLPPVLAGGCARGATASWADKVELSKKGVGA